VPNVADHKTYCFYTFNLSPEQVRVEQYLSSTQNDLKIARAVLSKQLSALYLSPIFKDKNLKGKIKSESKNGMEMKKQTTYQDITMCLFRKHLFEDIRFSNLWLILNRNSDFLKIELFQGQTFRKFQVLLLQQNWETESYFLTYLCMKFKD